MAFVIVRARGIDNSIIVNTDTICIIREDGSDYNVQFSAGNQFGVTLTFDQENYEKIIDAIGKIY